jgi:SagB-type dehydrogenase family enzyme
MESMEEYRQFLKSDWEKLSKVVSDQQKGISPPPVEKPFDKIAETIELVDIRKTEAIEVELKQLIANRRSRRKFSKEPFTLAELSFLLWATQGIKSASPDGSASFRTVPSAGARHAFETYICVNCVEGLDKGLYRYLPLERKLLTIRRDENIMRDVAKACCGQSWMATSAAIFVWSAIPYRMEWRYSVASHKAIALDAGHVCQNLYLAAEAIGGGVCAVAAYFQKEVDKVIGLDGKDEFAIYIAAAGKVQDRQ